jgi:hypothetical protein
MTDKDTLPEVHQGESQPQTDSKPTPSSYLDKIIHRKKQQPLDRKDPNYYQKLPRPKDNSKVIGRKP